MYGIGSIVKRLKHKLDRDRHFREMLSIHRQFASYTMMRPYLYADNLVVALKADHIPGDVVECGAWRGGMSAGLATVLTGDRTFYLFDSFEGMPPPTDIDGSAAQSWYRGEMPQFYYNNCAAEESFAAEAMLQTRKPFQLVKGWFNKTFPVFETQRPIAILRLDADWYDSILQSLEKFYPLLAEGGLVLLDDYYTWDGCSRAVHDYLSVTKSKARIYQSPNGAAYFFKPNEQDA